MKRFWTLILGWGALGCATTTPGAGPLDPSVAAPAAHVQWTTAASEQDRARAADRRASSADVRAAESRACRGLEDADRDVSPFVHVDDIVRVDELRGMVGGGPNEARLEDVVGAVVTFRAVPGMSVAWLQADVNCHLARHAALGNVPEMSTCPLVPNASEARVSRTESGFAVAIRGRNVATGRKILAHAQRLRGSISSR